MKIFFVQINELKNKDIQMRELERQHDDKLNIIRSMANPINTHIVESCATAAAVALGKGTSRRRPPTPYAESNENEEIRAVAYEHTEIVQVKKRCQSEERLLQVIILVSTEILIVIFLSFHVILVIRSVTLVKTRSCCCTKVNFHSSLSSDHHDYFLDDVVCENEFVGFLFFIVSFICFKKIFGYFHIIRGIYSCQIK